MHSSNKSIQNSQKVIYIILSLLLPKFLCLEYILEMLLPIAQEEFYKKTGSLITLKTHKGDYYFTKTV